MTRLATPPPDQDKPEVTTVSAVDEKVNGRVEGQQKIGDIGDVSTEEIQSRSIEGHLDGPDDVRYHGGHVADNAKRHDNDDHDGDGAAGVSLLADSSSSSQILSRRSGCGGGGCGGARETAAPRGGHLKASEIDDDGKGTGSAD